MARKAADLNCFALTQFLKREYWAWEWTQEELDAWAAAEAGDVGPLVKVIGLKLCKAGMPFQEAHGIMHDKDTRLVWDELECREIIQSKDKHVHMAVKFGKGQGGTLEKIAQAVGVEPQYIEKAGRGRYGYDNLLSYLIHAKDEDKYPYKAQEVKSLVAAGGKSYMDHYTEAKAEWEKGRAAKTRQRAEASIDDLEVKILSGEVTKSQVILTDQYYDIYARYKRRCDDAFEIYGERRAYKTIQALQDGDFKLTVFFVMGQAGAGKTRFTRAFVDLLARVSAEKNGGEAWRICQTAATNPLDDYNGEEILFMDDVRGGSLSASDWLKLLDPYNISPASARYHNKVPACRCIVITSSKEPLEFFYYCKQIGGDRSEALDQFMRRIQSTVQVIRADEWTAPEYRISDGQRTAGRLLEVPGTGGVKVNLSYGFGQERTMGEEEALAYLLGKVEQNSDLVAKLQDEAGEAAALAAAEELERLEGGDIEQ